MENVIGIISANYASKGLGTLTDERTIASLPFGGRYRMIDFPLSNMVRAGINTVGVITPYKYRSIIDHIGSGKEWRLDRKNGGLYILPGSVFGIANPDSRFLLRDIDRNSIYLMRSPADHVLITSANTVCNTDYQDFIIAHISSGADLTMMCKTCDITNPYMSTVTLKNGKVASVTPGVKAGDTEFIDCFIISRLLLLKILEWYKAVNYLDLFEILNGAFDKMDARVYQCSGYSECIMDVQSYYDTSMQLLIPSVRDVIFNREQPILTKVQDDVPTEYLVGASVQSSLVPSGCKISGAVRNSILFSNVRVEEGAVVENSIIMKGCVIGKNCTVRNAIIDRNNAIPAGTILRGPENAPYIMGKNMHHYGT